MAKKLNGRFLIAIDINGAHFRNTITVEHSEVSGIVTYDAKPVFSIKEKSFKDELMILIEKHKPNAFSKSLNSKHLK